MLLTYVFCVLHSDLDTWDRHDLCAFTVRHVGILYGGLLVSLGAIWTSNYESTQGHFGRRGRGRNQVATLSAAADGRCHWKEETEQSNYDVIRLRFSMLIKIGMRHVLSVLHGYVTL